MEKTSKISKILLCAGSLNSIELQSIGGGSFYLPPGTPPSISDDTYSGTFSFSFLPPGTPPSSVDYGDPSSSSLSFSGLPPGLPPSIGDYDYSC